MIPAIPADKNFGWSFHSNGKAQIVNILFLIEWESCTFSFRNLQQQQSQTLYTIASTLIQAKVKRSTQ